MTCGGVWVYTWHSYVHVLLMAFRSTSCIWRFLTMWDRIPFVRMLAFLAMFPIPWSCVIVVPCMHFCNDSVVLWSYVWWRGYISGDLLLFLHILDVLYCSWQRSVLLVKTWIYACGNECCCIGMGVLFSWQWYVPIVWIQCIQNDSNYALVLMY